MEAIPNFILLHDALIIAPSADPPFCLLFFKASVLLSGSTVHAMSKSHFMVAIPTVVFQVL